MPRIKAPHYPKFRSRSSSNTKKLKDVCTEKGVEAYHIESPAELRENMFKGKEHAGITAGTSTPHHVIEAVYNAILKMPGVDLEACSGLSEPEEAEDFF